MSKYTECEMDTFFRQDIDEIMAELHLEDSQLTRTLVEMRPAASPMLRQRIQAITKTERTEEIGKVKELHKGRLLSFLPRLMFRIGVVAAILLVAIFMLIAAVPSARAAVGRLIQQRFQQRFGLVLTEPSPETFPFTETEPGETELEEGETLTEIVEVTIPPLSLEEAQSQVAFTIPTPTLLPEGFALWNMRVGLGPHGSSMDEAGNIIAIEPPVQIILSFKPDEADRDQYHPDATVSLTVYDQPSIDGGYGAPIGNEIEVEVNGNEAIFIKGIWEKLDEVETPGAGNLIWNYAADAGMLSWEADGFTYVLQVSHLRLLQEDYIRIAESVR